LTFQVARRTDAFPSQGVAGLFYRRTPGSARAVRRGVSVGVVVEEAQFVIHRDGRGVLGFDLQISMGRAAIGTPADQFGADE